MKKTMPEIAKELLIENTKLRVLISRCQRHLESGSVGDDLYVEINHALARTHQYASNKIEKK